MNRCYKRQYLYEVLGNCFIGYSYRNIVQYCTWYNHSMRIRYNMYRHAGTCIWSACFISQGTIFRRSGPHGSCARFHKWLVQAHSNDNTGSVQGVRPFDPEPSLLTFVLRHWWCRVYICISKGDYCNVSFRGEHNMQGTSTPWVNKQGNYRICL